MLTSCARQATDSLFVKLAMNIRYQFNVNKL